jgi:hypothetical protein
LLAQWEGALSQLYLETRGDPSLAISGCGASALVIDRQTLLLGQMPAQHCI